MKLSAIQDFVVQTFATLATLLPIAEYLFDGAKRGPEKKAYVIDEASKLLGEHVNVFFTTALGKQLLGVAVDALVTLLNRLGNL